jgi:hypothetical protein
VTGAHRLAPAVILVAAMVALPGGSRAGDPPRATAHGSTFSELLRAHLARYPLARAADVYKFTHQSVFGPAHAVPSTAEARRWLDEELAALPPGPVEEPLVDRLGDDPPLVRLNLRPYVAAHGDIAALADAFTATAVAVKGDPATMTARLASAEEVLRDTGRAEIAAELSALAAEQAGHGYPAIHHSAAYAAAYAPAYRVVDAERLRGIGPAATPRH